jgi:carboxylesterase
MLIDAEPYSAEGGPQGALVIHGFTGSPQSMKPLARAFAAAGFTVELPLLPGHGTVVEEMSATNWQDWTSAIETTYLELATRCQQIVVVGLSMGGSLATWLATRHPEIAAIVLVNPLIDPSAQMWSKLLAAATASTEDYLPAVGSDVAMPGVVESAYDAVPVRPLLSLTPALLALIDDLSKITAPALVFVSPQDHVVDPSSSTLFAQLTRGSVITVQLLRSFHVATIDYDGPMINERAVSWAKSTLAGDNEEAGPAGIDQ